MDTPGITLAKLTTPRLHDAVDRVALYLRLDRSLGRKSACCIVGPPGSGKTTMAASWLDRRAIPAIWYQVDAGDSDLATFFYYLGEATRPYLRKDRHSLPLLTPEYQHDVAGFSRRFFRELFGLLPVGSIIVLDNYQEVDAASSFHALVAEAVSEVPIQSMLLVVSRRDPPDCYARLVANERVETIDWTDLRLSFDETAAISKLRLPALGAKDVQRLHEQCDGWAAGLTLMLEGYRKNESVSRGLPTERESIFAYFAAQIFEQLPEATKRFLVVTATLAQVPVTLARELTGDPRSLDILEDLYKRHLFTHRRPGSEPVFWYHALFRAFLKKQASIVLGDDALSDMQRRAARLLDARGSHDDAFQIFHEVRDWPSARRLIERHAEALLAKGRGQTLRDWIDALPQDVLDAAPWPRYWLGVSLLPDNQKDARHHLERAFEQFAANGDAMAQALAAAGMIESHFFEWSHFHPMRRWIDHLETLLDRLNFAGNAHAERKIYTGLLLGMLYAAPGHRLIRHTVSRVTEMLDEDMDVNSKVSIATVLLGFANLACDMERAARGAYCAESLLSHPDLTAINRLWAHIRLGYFYKLTGQYEKGIDALTVAENLETAHGFRGAQQMSMLITGYQIPSLIMTGDIRSANRCLARMVERINPARPTDLSSVAHVRAHLECAAGNYRQLAQCGAQLAEQAAASGMLYLGVLGVEHEAVAWACVGEIARLRSTLARLRQMIEGTCFAFFECEVRMLEAYSELRHGDLARGRELLADAISYARETGFQYPQMARSSVVVGVVLAEALRAGHQVDYVRDTVRRLRIKPPEDAPGNWPWPVRIFTLGRFEVFRDNEKLAFGGKAPRKVLGVLKTIVAGGGEPVAVARLIDAHWPDEDGDAARKAFDVSLVRLRRLLGDSESVFVRNEQVTLNRECCWVDAWTFVHLAENLASESVRPHAMLRTGQRAMELYRGNFLPADLEDKGFVVTRLKLRDRLARLVTMIGGRLEASRDWDAALRCYQQGIDIDELAEAFYQGAMRCQAALGRSAESLATYRRLRQTLSIVLGVRPSEASERLMKDLAGSWSDFSDR